MSYDEKLIDAVIAALPGSSYDELAELAQHILCAIDASGTHWIAPCHLPDRLRYMSGSPSAIFAETRYACLAERLVQSVVEACCEGIEHDPSLSDTLNADNDQMLAERGVKTGSSE